MTAHTYADASTNKNKNKSFESVFTRVGPAQCLRACFDAVRGFYRLNIETFANNFIAEDADSLLRLFGAISVNRCANGVKESQTV